MSRVACVLLIVFAVAAELVWLPDASSEGILRDQLKDGSVIQKVAQVIPADKEVSSLAKVEKPTPVLKEIPALPKVQPQIQPVAVPKKIPQAAPKEISNETSDVQKVQQAVSVTTANEEEDIPVKEMNIWSGGFNRTYLVHVPPSYNPSKPTALVVAFHSGGGFSRLMATDKYYGWISKSDKEGFIVVFPNGASPFKDGRFGTWNAGKCCAYARDQHIDDVSFVRDIVFDIEAAYTIDRKRIFATGMSNGGMMAYSLACGLPDMFRAIASVAGTDNTISCRPEKPVSILHIHAKDDDHVLFNGGAGSTVFKDKSKVTEFSSVQSTMSSWLKHNSCAETSKQIVDVPGATCDLYAQCGGAAQVQLCVTDTGGHSWPGAKATPLKKIHNPSNAINATDVIWDFFQAQN